ncbi:TIGR03032 family protein [Parathalassolituus penaei]|uniref:TIGR03032 family protein n=1 Tax=Parathalassolituus penaei TaxID=2997323 RepID=A0A9X3IRF9_9GAMM|nr:TIGR03032 family protein [Parathalassolituus penaei]MCY0965182.1 TIGR03032 family protein [Parathalassolituus penaei]
MSSVLARPEPDFRCEYSSNLPLLLKRLNIAPVFTSYQAARLMMIRSDGDHLDINFHRFPRPMGLSSRDGHLTLGTFNQVIRFQREDGLLAQIKQPLAPIEADITAPRVKITGDDPVPDERGVDDDLLQPLDHRADACLIARSSHFTGMINIHDLDWGDAGLWVVNSSFSCLATLQPDYSFVPRWKPHFISGLAAEDRCHLNGMCLKDGKPGFVTTFSTADTAARWRQQTLMAGTLMDVPRNEILLDNLQMPHSPRWYQGRVYYCNSALGQLCCYDPATGSNRVLAEVPGFTRGIDVYGPLLILGLSRVRQGNVPMSMPLLERYADTESGLRFYNLEDMSEIGRIRFTGNVDQIYDIAVLPGCSFPELITPEHPRMRNHFSHPSLQPLV